MKTGILLFEQHLGKKDIGSSRIRGHWIAKHWNSVGPDIGDAELFMFGRKYDAVIFQKAYFIEYAKAFKGVKILDMCDPDWMHWSFKVKEMADECDAITCSSMELKKTVEKFTDKPVYFVPDRVDLSTVPAPKVHTGATKTVVWYGYSQNFPILDSTIQALAKRGLELIVVSDGVYAPPASLPIKFTNYPFSQHYLTDIQKGDIVLNPGHKKGKWRYKSSNKTVIAKAIGMPVAHDAAELDSLLTEEARIEASVKGLEEVKKLWDVKYSVEEYKNIIKVIAESKK